MKRQVGPSPTIRSLHPKGLHRPNPAFYPTRKGKSNSGKNDVGNLQGGKQVASESASERWVGAQKKMRMKTLQMENTVWEAQRCNNVWRITNVGEGI